MCGLYLPPEIAKLILFCCKQSLINWRGRGEGREREGEGEGGEGGEEGEGGEGGGKAEKRKR